MSMVSKRRLKRHGKAGAGDPATDLEAARKKVREKSPSDVFAWMVAQSVKRQTIPITVLVAACEYVGGGRPGGSEQAFKDLEAACMAQCGLPLPLASDRRGASA